MCVDKSDDIVNKYKNTNHSIIKMKPSDVNSSTYVDSSKENNNKDPKFKTCDIIRIWKYKNIFAKSYTQYSSDKVFVIKKVKKYCAVDVCINDLNVKEIVWIFYEKELQKTNQKEFRIENVIKKKSNKLYVKWKRYNNSFNG